jgi:small subunit ribosomal protein S35
VALASPADFRPWKLFTILELHQAIFLVSTITTGIMATALQSLRITARSCQCGPVLHRYLQKPIGRRRPFSTTPLRYAPDNDLSSIVEKAVAAGEKLDNINLRKVKRPSRYASIISEEDMEEIYDETLDEFGKPFQPPDLEERKKWDDTFLNLGEEEPFDEEDIDEDTEEELSSLAHGELEHHREMRHYARLAAWDMPMLSSKSRISLRMQLDLGC